MMIFFITICIISLLVGIKVDQWETIKLLGFPFETPLFFAENSFMYHLISTILFVAAILFFIFYIDEIGLFVGVISLLVVFIGSAKIGHKLAYKEYRKIIKELMNDSSDPKEKEEFEEQLKKTDSELLERVTDRLKYKI